MSEIRVLLIPIELSSRRIKTVSLTALVVRNALVFFNYLSVLMVLNFNGLLLHVHFIERSRCLLKLVHRKRWILLDKILRFILARSRQIKLCFRRFLVINMSQPHALQLVLVAENSILMELACLYFVQPLFIGCPESLIFNDLVLLVA
jgi:hypothetical protein